MNLKIIFVTLVLALCGLSSLAYAQDPLPIDDGVWRPDPDCGCVAGPTKYLRAPVLKANIMKSEDPNLPDDGREALSKAKKTIGLSDATEARIRVTTGYVRCPSTELDRKHGGSDHVWASATLIGTNMQIATNSHIFYDDDGVERAPLSKCTFQNQDSPQQTVALDFDSGHEKIGVRGKPRVVEFNDYAVIPLKSPILANKEFPDSNKPFKISNSNLEADKEFLGVMAHQDVKGKKFTGLEPVIQKFRSKAVFSINGTEPSSMFSLAAASPGGSGGVNYRQTGDNLEIVSIFSSSGDESLDHQPYNGPTAKHTRSSSKYILASKSSYTLSIAVDGEFLDAVKSVRNSIPRETKGLIFADEK